jgi:hypothetical protein
MLLLGSMEQSLNDNRIRLCHIVFDQFLNNFGVKHEECSLCSLVVHALACLQQSLQEPRAEFLELLINRVAHQVKHFLDFLDKDDFFGGAGNGPEF